MLNYQIINNNVDNKRGWIVLVAGYTGSLETWYKFVEALNELGKYPILLVDNLGAGKSEQPTGKYTTKLMAEKILELIDFLKLQDINLIGHSLGGAVAQMIALTRPQLCKSLFLLCTFATLDNKCRHFLQGRYDLYKANTDKNVIAANSLPSVFSNKFLGNSAGVQFATSRIIDNPQTLDGMYGQLNACLDHDTTNEISNLKMPTTIITGAEDILICPAHSEFLHAKINNSRLIFVKDAAHMVQIEEPQQVASIINDCLTK